MVVFFVVDVILVVGMIGGGWKGLANVPEDCACRGCGLGVVVLEVKASTSASGRNWNDKSGSLKGLVDSGLEEDFIGGGGGGGGGGVVMEYESWTHESKKVLR